MKEPTLKKVAYGVAMAIAIIVVHFIDVYVYNMPPIFAIFLAIFITYLGIKLTRNSNKLDKKISRMQYNLLNAMVIAVLVTAYYLIVS